MPVGKVGTRTVPPRESGNRYPHPAAARVPLSRTGRPLFSARFPR
ncbi:hypothetical protein SAMN04487981_103246 [Streptomyces sp. cf386]|nr:hypothetical protein SAMN04487981_103246 [Streptomyces sp. cf386]